MANEIQAHLKASRTGSLTVVAKVLGSDGVQVGGDVALVEAAITSLFIGSIPGGTAAGFYSIRIEDDGALVAVIPLLEWNGTAEPRASTDALVEASKRTNNRQEIVGLNTALTELVTYDDDGVTVLRRDTLSTSGGEDVVTYAGVQTERTPQ